MTVVLNSILLLLALVVIPAAYVRLCLAMRHAAIQRPPYVHFFLIFGSLGGLLLSVVLSPGGLGALGAFVSAIIGPAVITLSSVMLFQRRRDSKFHKAALWSGLGYVGTIMALFSVAMAMHA